MHDVSQLFRFHSHSFSVPPDNLKCPTDTWLHYASSCYQAYAAGSERSFSEARAFCQSQGGDLMSVGSQEEEQSVVQPILDNYQLSDIFWIGLERKMDATGEDFMSDYEWIDGTLLDYNHFAGNTIICIF